MPGAEPAKVADAQEGELIALGRMEGIPTGMTISPSGGAEALQRPETLPPVYALAINTQDRKDDVKLSGALQKLVEEDPSLSIRHDQETGETVLAGQGEIHLNA